MLYDLSPWFSLVLIAGGLALVVRTRLTLGRGSAIHCPGPPHVWMHWINPLHWVRREACWYNLTGLPLLKGDKVRCPECGFVTAPAQRLRNTRRWRRSVVACLLLSAGMAGVVWPWFRSGQWVRAVPTIALVAFERLGPRCQPRALRHELYRRVIARETGGLARAWLIPGLIRDLRADERRWNAERACNMLDALWPAPREALERALVEGDEQCRIIAAGMLRERCPTDPSDALLAACVADLRDDYDFAPFYTTGNAREAAEYLAGFPHRIEPLLRSALHSDDYQQRLLAAVVAGFAGLSELVDDAAPLLIAQLRDDDVLGNAKMAAPALYRFGPAAAPFLAAVCDDGDDQLRALARAMLERLRYPDRPRSALRNPAPVITELTNDALSLDIEGALRDTGSVIRRGRR